VQGQIIKSGNITASPGSNLIKADVKQIGSGIYFIRIYNDKYSIQQKFVKM
jgi:hypothetical protein